MKKIIALLIVSLASALPAMAAEITGAYGYQLGEVLLPADVVSGEGIGPYIVRAKEKARAVRTVRLFITPDTKRIFSINGENFFPTMHECGSVSEMIGFFLRKKHGDVLDTTETIGDGMRQRGRRDVDTEGKKSLSIVCVQFQEVFRLSVEYLDMETSGGLMRQWKDGQEDSGSSGQPGVSL